MKWLKWLGVGVVALVLGLGALLLFVPPPSAPSTPPPNDLDRLALGEAFLSATESVAEKTGDEEAKEIAAVLRSRACIGAPHEQGTRLLQPQREGSFPLVPLLAGDERSGGGWETRLTIPAIAVYHPDYTMISTTPGEISQTWRGLALLHEGHHLVTHERERYNHRDPYAFCVQEARTHQFQNRLMAKLGGAPYQVFLERKTKELLGKTAAMQLPPGQYATEQPSNELMLVEVFGPPTTELEGDWRATSIAIALTFSVIEALPTVTNKEEARAAYLQKLYIGTGLFETL